MSKMIFIEPKSPNYHIYTQFSLPRLGSFILGTLMKNRGWDVEILFEQNQPINYKSLATADLIGISTITATAPRAYAIADKLRDLNIPVIMGGPHVTFMTDEALEHADFVIRGEGETALMQFIDVWENQGDLSRVPNLSWKRNSVPVHNDVKSAVQDLDTIPVPDFELSSHVFKKVAGRRIIPIQTSRGCPFDCSFCSVTGMFGRKYRFRSTEHIIEELKQYNHRQNYVFFYDDHFTADKKRAKALLQAMIDEKLKFKWSTQVRVEVAKDLELVRLMKKAGCHTLFIGLESVNPESLKAMNKSQSVEDIKQAIQVLKKQRIHVHGMFVYGFDEDDWHTVKETVKFARKAQLTSTQFLILTPLPGSHFFEKMRFENRIRLFDWNLYDAHHVVFEPKRLSFAELQKAQIFSHQKFYSLKESAKRLSQLKWLDLGLAHYARNLNRLWKKRNRTFLKVLDLLTPQKYANIRIDYQEKVQL